MILITGASGSLGKILLKEISRKYKVRVILRQPPKRQIKGVEYRIGDFYDRDFIITSLENILIVIHLAAETRSSNKILIKESNQQLTNNLLDCMTSKKIKGLYFTSTILCKKKLSNYSKSKIDCERIIAKFNFSYYQSFRIPPIINDLDSGKGNFTLNKIKNLLSILPILPIPVNVRIPHLKISDLISHIFWFIEQVIQNKKMNSSSIDIYVKNKSLKEIFTNNSFYFHFPFLKGIIKLILFTLKMFRLEISPTIETLYLIFDIKG